MDDLQPQPASQATTAQATAAPDAVPPGLDGVNPSDSLLTNVKQLLRELPGLVSDRVHLLALELKRSGLALAQMVGLVIAAGVLLCTAWLALWVGIGIALVQAGLAWGWALLLILLLNLGAAWLAVKRALTLARYLALPATLRRLTLRSPEPSPRRGAGTDLSTPSAGAPDERPASVAGTP
ncbi:phage holin family protein [Azohydromonas caseinilytica]|uniref:Phage holin family protein n=1 Tax=Azohydromonas caseinilytica TaxID=2728836 RepID=A0A848F5H4_9BURK|nr:phage holin family protein [Azohydromonas caseinilytica]NML13550.1 phage holin family protein [Azohydromonas caseinilytica]